MKIASGIHQLKIPIPNNSLKFINCYLIKGKDGWFLIDTGWHTDEAFDTLQTGLTKIGLTFRDLSSILVTHVHADHFGLAGRIKQISPKTELFTHCIESHLIESRYIKFSHLLNQMSLMLKQHGVPSSLLSDIESASMPILQFVTVTFPDQILFGGEVLSTGIYDLEVIWTPGHAPGHICFYEPINKILFSGDHVLPHVTPNVSYHVQSGDNPLGDYMYSLNKLSGLFVNQVLPGHEETFTNLQIRIKQIINHHRYRIKQILRVLSNNLMNAWDLSSQITWNTNGVSWISLPPLQKRSAIVETVSHLEFMKWQGKIERIIREDKMVCYRRKEVDKTKKPFSREK